MVSEKPGGRKSKPDAFYMNKYEWEKYQLPTNDTVCYKQRLGHRIAHTSCPEAECDGTSYITVDFSFPSLLNYEMGRLPLQTTVHDYMADFDWLDNWNSVSP